MSFLFQKMKTTKKRTAYLFFLLVLLLGILGFVISQKASFSKQSFATSTSGPKIGLDLLNNLDRLPDIRKNIYTYQVSSHDKTGRGRDFLLPEDSGLESYLYQENGKYVIFDQSGPGSISRIFFAWVPQPQDDPSMYSNIHFYFDGEVDPRISMSMRDLFSGEVSPFLYPLVGQDYQSSGGHFSYVPMSFSQSLKIVVDQVPTFYDITYDKYPADIQVNSFTGNEDVTQSINKLTSVGIDPKNTSNNITTSNTISIPAGGEATIFNRNAPGTVNSIKINIPQIVPAPIQNSVTDKGRVHNGQSQFRANISQGNSGVRLTRRLDYGIANQSARVYVDNSLVGTWSNTGSDTVNRWRDSQFIVPWYYLAGKSSIQIRMEDVAGGSNWTEYFYKVESNIDGQYILTDVLDVGDLTMETNKQYQITGQVSVGEKTYTYPPVSGNAQQQLDSREILTKTKIKGFWDGQVNPSVDAPIGGFFGSWAGEVDFKSLLIGMDPNGYYYSYYPMPFSTSGVIKIKNESAVNITNLSYEIAYDPNLYAGIGSSAGYFKATTNQALPTTTGTDYKMLQVSGSGHIVGTVLFTKSLTTTPVGLERTHLEGEERIHVDGSSSPALYGTGTEEYFNSGFYFARGMFSLPSHGHPFHSLPVESGVKLDESGFYRSNLTDPVSFRSGINFGMEHGDPWWDLSSNQRNANYQSVIFWYGLDETEALLTDNLDVGNSVSEQQHSYNAPGSSQLISGDYKYEGDNDHITVLDDGNTNTGNIQFNIAIDPDNDGVVIRRRLDQSIRNQKAVVSIDGVEAGTWYDPGRNTSKRWKDGEFIVSSDLTSGKSTLLVSLEPQDSVPWSAFTYWTYSITKTPKINVNITSPLAGSFNYNTVSVNANVVSENPVERVEFYADTTLVGTDYTAPYSTGWNTTAFSKGKHLLAAKAYDNISKQNTSPVISVNATVCPDYNSDGFVTVADITTLVQYYGKGSSSPGWNPNYDLNGDNFVSVADLTIAVGLFGVNCNN